MDNPNHSNRRYEERNEMDLKRRAFDSKNGYSERGYKTKLKDQMNGMPMPMHMRGKDCP